MWGASLLLLAASALWSADTRAQLQPDELARRHFESGAAYFEQAEYESALKEFRKAYELSGRHQILRNVSVVQERLGNLEGAIEALDAFLQHAPNDPAAATMTVRRDNLKKRLEKRREEDAQTEAFRREQERIEYPPQQPEPARPAEAAPAAPAPSPRSQQPPDLLPAYILLGAGALSGAGAILTGVVAQLEYNDAEDTCSPVCTDSEVGTAESLALTSTILTGVSVATLGAGLIWWATADTPHEQTTAGQRSTRAAHTPRVTVAVSPTLGFAEASWRF